MPMDKIVTLLFLIATIFVNAQEKFAVSDISEDLRKNANAVIRAESTILELKDFDKLVEKYHIAITVLNRSGLKAVSPIVYYKKSSSVNNIEAYLYDKTGKRLKKFKEKDFVDASASGGNLYSDNRMLYLDYVTPAYPFTFEFVYEKKSSTTGFLPQFIPLYYSHVAVEKSSYQLINEKKIPLTLKEHNLEEYKISKKSDALSLSYTAQNLKGFVREHSSPHFMEYLPVAKVALKKFRLEGNVAEVSSWKDFGTWQNENLLKGRDALSSETVAKISAMLKDIPSEREKVKAVYEYMQGKTRYISVQVGIGGWQPTEADEVDELSYGDCKGLTNYTKALLKSQGIESYYTIVDSGKDGVDLDEDFVAMQGNHVILTVPMKEEKIFLECTSQKLPFNFLGTHTDNRKVLMITPEGGVMTKTHTYTEKDNKRDFEATVVIAPSLEISGVVKEKSYGLRYGSSYELEDLTKKEISSLYKDHFGHINNLKISNVVFENDKENIVFTENFNFEGTNYISKAGDRLLLNPNVFNRFSYAPNTKLLRKVDIDIRRGKTLKDVIKILLPEGYKIESSFDPIAVSNEFGSYKASIIQEDETTLVYEREVVLLAGRFPKEHYKIYDGFLKSLVKNDKSKIVLVKK